MSPEQLRFLVARGWTVSSHSHSHPPTNQEGIDLDMEVRISREELAKALGAPVRLFAYWNNLAIADRILPVAQETGYLGILSIGNPFNDDAYDVWDIKRGTMGRDLDMWLREPTQLMYHHTVDAFPGHLTRENTRGKWLVDITHIVAERLPAANSDRLWNRCSTPAILDARLREVSELWPSDELWATVPEDVIEYTLLRRAATVATRNLRSDSAECTVKLEPLPSGIQSTELTFKATGAWSDLSVNDGAVSVHRKDDAFLWTMPVHDGDRFTIAGGR